MRPSEAWKRGPAGALLAVELPHGLIGLVQGPAGFAGQRRGLRDQEAHLGDGYAAVHAFELGHGLLRRLLGL